MTKGECGKIFLLLSKFYPNAKQVKDPDTRLAWSLVLERYPYEKVRSACLTHAARCKFFPDVADLTGNLVAGDTPEQQAKDIEHMKRMLAHMKKEDEQ